MHPQLDATLTETGDDARRFAVMCGVVSKCKAHHFMREPSSSRIKAVVGFFYKLFVQGSVMGKSRSEALL